MNVVINKLCFLLLVSSERVDFDCSFIFLSLWDAALAFQIP